ncbi:MAG TPA: alkyl sulfatase dimerization domain-containing protein [Polyangiaceae bacterium]|jgi:alkyl sulfatase BDS1-like metallo-beta-lactamase superfamily hydrolase
MGRILELAEKLWSGKATTEEYPPYMPLLEMETIAEGVAFVSGFANVTAIATGDGVVLIDVGSLPLSGITFSRIRGWNKDRVHTAVFTHGHLDHVMGLGRFDEEARTKGWPSPRVIAHESMPARFERYKLTGGYNSHVNSQQFQIPIEWPTEFRTPNVLYRDSKTVEVGGVTFELHHARGETDDHTWVWIPSRKLLCTGDLFLWCCPNAGNPTKVQRYPRDWARALRAMAGVGAEVLAPGHGVPIVGAARIKQALSETAELLEHLHDKTVEAMNTGMPLEQVLRTVRAPEGLMQRPYLKPVYDDPEFIVRNVWRLYGGWWDGDPSHLKPAPSEDLARELATLAGGAGRLAERATELAAQGDLALACHLAELAGKAAPGDAEIAKARADVYSKRSQAERSLMAKSIFAAAAGELGKRGA